MDIDTSEIEQKILGKSYFSDAHKRMNIGGFMLKLSGDGSAKVVHITDPDIIRSLNST